MTIPSFMPPKPLTTVIAKKLENTRKFEHEK
jgi:hypothetical protein